MTVLITLVTAGANTGPFDLYSNLDGYLSAFETGVPKASLQAGYTSYLVPNGTTVIRVKSTNAQCNNYIDISLVPVTTTTTSSTTSNLPYTARIEVSGIGDGAGSVVLKVQVTGGTTADNLTFDAEVFRYTDSICTTQFGAECPVTGVVLPSATASVQSSPLCSIGPALKSKVLTLSVNGNVISSSPQTITVGLNTYEIVGFNVCNFI